MSTLHDRERSKGVDCTVNHTHRCHHERDAVRGINLGHVDQLHPRAVEDDDKLFNHIDIGSNRHHRIHLRQCPFVTNDELLQQSMQLAVVDTS